MAIPSFGFSGANLAELEQQTLTCELTYDRWVGNCYLPDGDDLTAILIEQGVCGRCARYDLFRRYAAAEAKAGPYRGEVPGYCTGLR